MKAKCLVFLIVPAFIFASCSIATVVAPPSVAPGMLTFTSPKLGVSFRLPPGWTSFIWDPGGENYLVTLFPPAGAPDLTKVEFTALSFEIGEGIDLRTWSENHYFLLHGAEGVPKFIAEGELRDQAGGAHQWLHESTDILGPVQQAYVTYGRLVLVFVAYNHTDAMARVLLDIIASLSFTPDAPRSLNELWGTQGTRVSLEEALEEMTGHPEPEECGIVCQDATATAKITPSTPPTPSQEYLEQEKQFNEQMMTRAAYTRTPTPTRTATPTPMPASRPGYAIYEGIGYNGSRNRRGTYRITYSTDQWRVESNDTQRDVLRQLQIPACTLELRSRDREATPPFVRDTLTVGILVWSRLSMPNGGTITYAVDAYGDYYVLELTLPQEAAATQVQPCQAAAEEVIVTFELINPPR